MIRKLEIKNVGRFKSAKTNPIGGKLLKPISLKPKQKDVCKLLDELYENNEEVQISPSDVFRGAIFSIRVECRKNPDQIAQTAHSLRELLYPLKRTKNKINFSNADKAFLTEEINHIYGLLTRISHHDSSVNEKINKKYGLIKKNTDHDNGVNLEAFEELVLAFETAIYKALSEQFYIRNNIKKSLKNPN